MDINIKPVGIVKNSINKPRNDSWKEVVSEIEIEQRYEQALDQLDDFSHIIVIFWMCQVLPEKPAVLKIHPRGRKDLPPVGVFASRSPIRPNPIGVTVVRLLKQNNNILSVQGLDAIDGTPVIDIKPFIPENDVPLEAKTPAWVKKLTE